MGISYYSIGLFALLINRVSLEVVGVIGGSVVLPCSSSDTDPKSSNITVYWRHNGSLNVYDIINGKSSVQDQNPKYKNRAETLSEDYGKGSFSLKLSSLSHADAGEYQCFVTHSDELVKVKLLIQESTKDKGDQAEETRLLWMRILIPLLCVLVIIGFCICIVFRFKKKKKDKNSCFVLSAPEGFRLQTKIEQ